MKKKQIAAIIAVNQFIKENESNKIGWMDSGIGWMNKPRELCWNK